MAWTLKRLFFSILQIIFRTGTINYNVIYCLVLIDRSKERRVCPVLLLTKFWVVLFCAIFRFGFDPPPPLPFIRNYPLGFKIAAKYITGSYVKLNSNYTNWNSSNSICVFRSTLWNSKTNLKHTFSCNPNIAVFHALDNNNKNSNSDSSSRRRSRDENGRNKNNNWRINILYLCRLSIHVFSNKFHINYEYNSYGQQYDT